MKRAQFYVGLALAWAFPLFVLLVVAVSAGCASIPQDCTTIIRTGLYVSCPWGGP